MKSGNQQGASVVDELQEQENILQQCVRQLESAEATRTALISELKEALQDQVWPCYFILIILILQVYLKSASFISAY